MVRVVEVVQDVQIVLQIPRGSRGRPTGSLGAKGWAYKVPGVKGMLKGSPRVKG